MTEELTRRKRPGGRSARISTQVHQALRQLLAEGDESRITIAAIAERSGVHISTIYRRWNDIGTLIADVALGITRERMPIVDTGALATDLLEFYRSSIAFVRSPTGRILIKSLPDAPPEWRELYWSARLEALGPFFGRAIERGEVAADADVRGAWETMTGLLYFRLLFSGDPADDEALARAIVDAGLLAVGLERLSAPAGRR